MCQNFSTNNNLKFIDKFNMTTEAGNKISKTMTKWQINPRNQYDNALTLLRLCMPFAIMPKWQNSPMLGNIQLQSLFFSKKDLFS